MNDILFGNNNTKTIKRLSKQYFKKNKVRNLAAILAIVTSFRNTKVSENSDMAKSWATFCCSGTYK